MVACSLLDWMRRLDPSRWFGESWQLERQGTTFSGARGCSVDFPLGNLYQPVRRSCSGGAAMPKNSSSDHLCCLYLDILESTSIEFG